MAKPLVIVESPTKARKLAEFLGPGYAVEASVGHVRDLPRGAAEVPAAYKGEPWARLGVDTDNDFKPLYVVPAEKRDQIRKLKALLKDADELYLATDEDREGESISWHLLEVLGPRVPVRRMVFHEITRSAIQQAVDNTRDLDLPLVDAQETRRILDRLYGYEVSPVLWKKVLPNLSAGRVQSVATRIVVERERERMRFRTASYWDVEGRFSPAAAPGDSTAFPATLVALDGSRVAAGRDFDDQGRLSRAGTVVLDEAGARGLTDTLVGADFAVRSVEEKPYRSSPKAPFMTSTLQQEAGRKLRLGSVRCMQVAQRLYENGFITYMRTDSTSLSPQAIDAARSQARAMYGPEYVPAQPRRYDKKVKNAQEAHEAIRPAGESFRTPEQVRGELRAEELRLYELIWKRTVASQMADATGSQVSARLGARAADGRDAEFSASGRTITFPGYMRAYVEGADDPEAQLDDRQAFLPPLAVGEALGAESLEAKGHQTQPPARYTEASLVRRLEELGVGRPSTYATIMQTIQDREYVWKRGPALVPSWTAFAVVNLLERHFSHLVDYGFTAKLEDDLDRIANREAERVPWLTDFYFGTAANGTIGGDANDGLKSLVNDHLDEIDPREVNSIPVGDGIVVRVGRYGPYVQRDEDRASVPEGLAPDELTVDKAVELLAAGSAPDEPIGTDPGSGLPVYVKSGRFGAYVQLGEIDDGSKTKPPRASLFKSMDPEAVTLDAALRLLSLPRVLGTDPTSGEAITAQNGRYGPYLSLGKETRSLSREEELFTVTLDQARALLAEPKTRRGGEAKPPLKELGPDPATGADMVVKDGRFGPYVTDGTTNASLRKADSIEDLTDERAAELLADRRAAGPSKKRGAKKSPAPKKTPATAKKPAPKPVAKTTAAKKSAAKKSAAKRAAPNKATAEE